MKKLSPTAVVSLKHALSAIYWYKKDLKGLLLATLGGTGALLDLDWTETKRDIVSRVVDRLADGDEKFQGLLIDLMSDVAVMDDFSHLAQLDDGELKAKQAKDAVTALRKQVSGHVELAHEKQRAEERKRVASVWADQVKRRKAELDELRKKYVSLITSPDAHARGYELQSIMRELFNLFDLDPKASFRITGEQIDGAFTFDNTDYLFEAAWQKELVGAEQLRAFSGKLTDKLDNTLGLFLSINGYTPDGVKAFSRGRCTVLLIDGAHLMSVLEGRIDLDKLFLRIRRHASQTGDVYWPVAEILGQA